MLNFFPLTLISLPTQILSISLPTKPPHLTHSSSPPSLLLQQSINLALPKVIWSIREEAISGRNEAMPSFCRAFSLYDQINLIDKVPEDQLRFQGYTETGFIVNGIEREGSLLCIGNFLLSWASTTLSQVTPQRYKYLQQLKHIQAELAATKVALERTLASNHQLLHFIFVLMVLWQSFYVTNLLW